MKVAPILQIGTLFKDVGEFVVVFNKHFGSEKAWSAKMLSTHTVLVKKRLSDSYSRQFGVRLIEQKIEKNYFKVGEEKGIEFVERAFEKFETTEIDDIRVPKDLKTFGIWWKNGRFISCNSDLAKNYTSANAKITSDHIKSLKTFTNMLIAAGQIPSLAFGTLLGWYRNCGVIPYTTDIDISIKVGEFSEEFLQSMKGHTKFKLLRSIGDAEYAREMTVQIPGSGGNSYADVFYRYPVNASFEWTGITYGQDSGWSRLRCVFPTISDLCTGEISGELFFVPCNFLANIQASYGNTDWLEPQDKNYYYTGHDRLVFSDGNWNKNLTDVIRYY
ncbi:hypothetical protein L596_006995 [Steinernema carpocapsae]|uniref:LicD family protein n=1 Tax=Steinernema carpocapsae TaxID=34508 RepID=A0A4U5P8W6_STECR|nr:hypothetical protein L596_006995 [Steinernema carpocapsae]